MVKLYDFSGKNVEQALELASQTLSIPIEKIRHEVISYGSSGIFGLVGVKKAKIKVFVEPEKKQTGPANKQEKTIEMIETPTIPEDIIYEAAQDDNELAADLVEYGRNALQTIVDEITIGAKAELNQKENKLFFSISGGDSGVLIGKRGQTLEAIQYLLEKMINKKSTNRVRAIVDVEGYLEKRKSNLQKMAMRMAQKAKKLKKPVTIGQMNAHDRRIVHIQLKDEEGIRTQSIGDGYYRKLMIFPKKQGWNKRRKRE